MIYIINNTFDQFINAGITPLTSLSEFGEMEESGDDDNDDGRVSLVGAILC